MATLQLPMDTTNFGLILFLALALAASGIIYLFGVKYRSDLKQIPGPFLASISNLDRIWSCAKGLQMNYHLKLHEKYGPLVRVGPNHVSFSDCSYIPIVYGISSKFWKSDFYTLFDIKTPTGTNPSIFSVRDEEYHREMRRNVASAYSLSTMKELEPMNNACSEVLMRKLDGLVGQHINLGDWVHWYAFDVITSITFSNNMGMLEEERDINNIIAAVEGRLVYNSIIGQAPWLHKYLFGNSIVSKIANFIPAVRILNSAKYIVAFTGKQLERYNKQEFNTIPLKDMLDRFKKFKEDEQVITEGEMLAHATGHILAGSDTTATSLRSIFYHLCRSPTSKRKLLAEIDGASLSDPVTFAEAQVLPYFQAVLKEALRMHPAVGLLLERVVPRGGAETGGVLLKEGTVVGMNPWVAARDKETYGEDADIFRPERWLDADEKQLKMMERNFLAFGGGARTCIGKNISILEMSKLVPQVLRRFDFELSYPDREWTLHDYWFVKQTGLICKVKRRGQGAS